MTIRTALVGCTLAFATLAGNAAFAGDPYGGFGPSVANTPEVNTDAATAPAPDIDQSLPWLQPAMPNQQSYSGQTQQENYGGGGLEWYEQRVLQDDGSDIDDASGH